jgi:hypothetical protein
MFRTILVAIGILLIFWFMQTLSGEMQEARECEDREGDWIKERCIEKENER